MHGSLVEVERLVRKHGRKARVFLTVLLCPSGKVVGINDQSNTGLYILIYHDASTSIYRDNDGDLLIFLNYELIHHCARLIMAKAVCVRFVNLNLGC